MRRQPSSAGEQGTAGTLFKNEGTDLQRAEPDFVWGGGNFGLAIDAEFIAIVKASPYHERDNFRIDAFFAPAGFNTGEVVVSQRVVFDDNADRFIIFVVTENTATDEVVIYTAYSSSHDPETTVWSMTRTTLLDRAPQKAATHFCAGSEDDLLYNFVVGIDRDRLFIAFEDLNRTTFTGTGSLIDIALKDLRNGGTVTLKCFENLEQFPTPPTVDNDTTALGDALFLAVPDNDTIKRYRLTEHVGALHDTMAVMPDLDVPYADPPPAAQQPNGLYLDAGDHNFHVPSVQIGTTLYNVHTVSDANGFAKVRLLKIDAAATTPDFVGTISTLADGLDHTFAPSIAVDSGRIFVGFTRTIPSDATRGRASLMLAYLAADNPTTIKKVLLEKSPGEISKNAFGLPCNDSLQGCPFGPNTVTFLDPDVPGRVWSIGEIITNGTLGGAGSIYNWRVDAAIGFTPPP